MVKISKSIFILNVARIITSKSFTFYNQLFIYITCVQCLLQIYIDKKSLKTNYINILPILAMQARVLVVSNCKDRFCGNLSMMLLIMGKIFSSKTNFLLFSSLKLNIKPDIKYIRKVVQYYAKNGSNF